MPDYQFQEPLRPREIKELRILALWLFPIKTKSLQILSDEETQWAKKLPIERARQYQFSRTHLRDSLSKLLRVPPLDIPIKAIPGKPPTLEKGWGYVSISHCSDALLIGWSPIKLGIDIERLDRTFSAQKIANRYFSEEEMPSFNSLTKTHIGREVLKAWVKKEASIKWQRGSINRDLLHWKLMSRSKIAVHKNYGYKLNIESICYRHWTLATATDFEQGRMQNMLCIN